MTPFLYTLSYQSNLNKASLPLKDETPFPRAAFTDRNACVKSRFLFLLKAL